MKLLKITCLTLIVIALGISNSRSEEKPKSAIESASPEQFEVLLGKVKRLHAKGEATYYSSDIDNDWLLFKPSLIVVRHNVVEIFINTDLAAPILLSFTRAVGVWSPYSSRWTVNLKKPSEAKSSELWTRTGSISEDEIKQDRKYTEYRDSMKTAEQDGGGQPATPSQSK